MLVIGLGQIGLPVAKYAKISGFDTYGYDISRKAMERAQDIAGINQTNDFKGFDAYVICVATHKPDDMFSPQTGALFSVVDKIASEAPDGALVSIESTIPQDTSKKVADKLGHRLHVVHAPHRYYSLEENEHGVNQLRVIGGVYECCLKRGLEFYNGGAADGSKQEEKIKSLHIPMHVVSRVEIAELTKTIENTHRYLQIAFAEELYLYCKHNDIDFNQLRNALNSKWNVNIMEPRGGIGGHCLPKDTKMFLQSSEVFKSKIISAAIEADLDYRFFIGSHNTDARATASIKIKEDHQSVLPSGGDSAIPAVANQFGVAAARGRDSLAE